jgi:hypothetical protein
LGNVDPSTAAAIMAAVQMYLESERAVPTYTPEPHATRISAWRMAARQHVLRV